MAKKIAFLALLGVLVGGISTWAAADTQDGTGALPSVDKIWQGLYLGADASYGAGNSELNAYSGDGSNGNYFNGITGRTAAVDSLGAEHAKAGDVAAGLDGGYDYQYKRLVVGLEADLSSLALDESTGDFSVLASHYYPQFFQSLHTDWTASLRPHVGLAWGAFLVDVNAGVSMVHANESATFTDSEPFAMGSATSSRYLFAPIFGLDVRYHVSRHWVCKVGASIVQYGLDHLGNSPIGYAPGQAPNTGSDSVFGRSFNLTVETLNLGLDYQF